MNAWFGLVGALVLVAAIILLFRRAGSSSNSAEQNEKEIFRLCRGDREMMERLIALEQKRSPGQNRDAATRAAIRSLKRDNR